MSNFYLDLSHNALLILTKTPGIPSFDIGKNNLDCVVDEKKLKNYQKHSERISILNAVEFHRQDVMYLRVLHSYEGAYPYLGNTSQSENVYFTFFISESPSDKQVQFLTGSGIKM